jgi:hypothetical protein
MHRSIVENDDDVKRRRDGLERQSNLVVAGDFRVMRDRRWCATLGGRVGLPKVTVGASPHSRHAIGVCMAHSP